MGRHNAAALAILPLLLQSVKERRLFYRDIDLHNINYEAFKKSGSRAVLRPELLGSYHPLATVAAILPTTGETQARILTPNRYKRIPTGVAIFDGESYDYGDQ